jgi:hypothetical protein
MCVRFTATYSGYSSIGALRKLLFNHRVLCLASFWIAGLILLGGRFAEAQFVVPTDYRNYAIIGQSTVSLNSYSTTLGDVYSAGDLTLEFGYGIQKPSLNAGSFFTRGNFVENSLSDVNGNVAANGSLTLLGSADLNGSGVYGTTVSYPNRSQITGSLTQSANFVPVVNLPTIPAFTYGTQNISASGDLVLQPGSYRDVVLTGIYSSLTLSTGDYYLKSLNASSSSSVRTLNLNISNGPIRVFSDGDIAFGNYLNVYVNGELLNSNASMPQAAGALASSILFASNQNISISTGSINSFAGTLFAPNGSVDMNMGTWYGSIMAGGAVNSEGYLVKQSYNFENAALASIAAAPNSIIVGGSKAISASLTNLAPAGGGTLNYTATSQVASGGLTLGTLQPNPGTVAPGATSTLTVSASATQIGPASISFNINDPNAYSPNTVGHAQVTVLDHAAPAIVAGSAARAMQGSTAYGTATIRNTAATYRAGLQIVNNGGLLDVSNGTVISNGGSAVVRGALDTSSFGPTSATFTVNVSDDQSIAGATTLADQQVVVSGNILDNRRVTAPTTVDLGIVHSGAAASGIATLSSVGADSLFTRITVNNSASVDANGLAVGGATTGFRFGLDGLTTSRTVSGIPNKLGVVTGTINLITNAEAGIPGTQTLANVPVSYSVKVFSGQSTWNGSTSSVWGNHLSWTDNLSSAGAGSPGISGFSGDTATFGNAISNNPATVSLNGSSPTLSSLTFDNNLGGSYTVATGTGGALTLNAIDTAITVGNGSHQITAPISFTNGKGIAVFDPLGTLTIDGAVTSPLGITKTGPGALALTSTSNSVGPIAISSGTLSGSVASLNNSIANNGSLVFDQGTDVTFSGTVTGNGTITKTGVGRMTLSGIGNFSSTAPITISDGALVVPFGLPQTGAGIQVLGTGTLETAFSLPRAVSGTGTITATDDLLIGRSNLSGQFNLGGAANIGGTLNVGNKAVVILSSDAAILGSQTTISDQGSLTTLNGARLGGATSIDATKILNATGNVAVNGDFINNGIVNGPSVDGQWLTFTQDVRGAGSTNGNVLYAGGYSPGNSPAVVTVQNIAFDSTSILNLEIGGTGIGEFDQLSVSGLATLAGTLNLSLLNGYQLESGFTYPLISGNTQGQFDQVVGVPAGWFLVLSSTGLTLVPEPSAFILTIMALLMLTRYRRRC